MIPNERKTTFRVLVCIGLLATIIGLQVWSKAVDSEYGWYPDEPAHYVTGLMFTEFIRQGFPGSPLTFARDYYLHYPKVAIGNWPPLFYGVQALWGLPFGSGKQSMYALMAVIHASTAIGIFLLAEAALGLLGAALLGLIFVLNPMRQEVGSMMMSDALVTLLAFAAMYYFAKYWEHLKVGDAVLYGIITGLTILTKGSGIGLTLIPVFAILISRRWSVLKDKGLWISAAIVIVLGAPWTVLTLKMVSNGWQTNMTLVEYMWFALKKAPVMFAADFTWLMSLILLLSLFHIWRRKEPLSPLALASIASVLSTLAFLCIAPLGIEHRYLLMAFPPALLICAEGLRWLGGLKAVALTAFVTLFLTLPPALKPHYGYVEAARYFVNRPDWVECACLISTKYEEGMMISEVASLEPKPRRFLLRATKMIAADLRWNIGQYKMKFQTPEEAQKYLDDTGIRILSLDNYTIDTPFAHHDLMWKVVANKELWELAAEFPGLRGPGGQSGKVSLFRRRDLPCVAKPKIDIDLRQKNLGTFSN